MVGQRNNHYISCYIGQAGVTVIICFKEGKTKLDHLFSLNQQSVLSQISCLNERGNKLAKELFAGNHTFITSAYL